MKKSISFILVMLMVLCMVPGVALADSNVAKIKNTGVEYSSIKAAVNAANTMSGNITIEMIDNEVVSFTDTELSLIGTSEGVDIYSLINVENNITIDLNGKSITATTGDKNIVLINVQKDGNLTLDDSIGGGSISVTADVNTYALLCCLDTTSKMTINDGNYSLNKGMVGQALIYAREDKSVSINGGNFSMGNTGTLKNGSPWIFNAKYQDANRIVVTGGTFNDEINHQFWEYEVEVPKEKALKNNGDGTWTVVDAVAYVDEWCKKYSSSGDIKVSREIGYATLAEAVAAANTYSDDGIASSETYKISLLKDCVVDETLDINEDATIELKDKTIIWEGDGIAPIFNATEGTLTIADFTPIRSGYTFGGWYTDEARTSSYNLAEKGKVEEGTSLYAKWEKAADNAEKISSGSGISITYNGGNSFSTSKSDVPTGVEIDGVPVTFNGIGSNFTVGCISSDAKWITVRWNSTSVTTNFTPNGAYFAEVEIPKTGDMPFWAAIAEFLGF